MSSWNMNDGSALSGTYTFTNGSAVVQGNSSADTSELKIGDIVIDDNGDRVRVKNIQPSRTVATSAVNASNEQVTITDHGFVANQEVLYEANGGTAIAGLTDSTVFFIKTVSSANAFTLSATAGGSEIDITGTGNNAQTFTGASTKAFTATGNFSPSTNSGSSCTVTRPPHDFDSAFPHTDDTNIFGVTATEAEAGFDNITSLALGTSAGTTYQSAPSVTIPAPTVRTIATAKVSTANNTIEISGHNIRTGTELKYQDGSGTALAGLVDNTSYFAIRHTEDLIKLASSLSNAQAGTAINLTGTGNNAQTLEGIQATATATVSSAGKVTGYTITNVGSDYQSAPSITVAAPGTETLDLTDSSVFIVADDEIVVSSGFYGAIETGDQVTYDDGSGGTAPAGFTAGETLFLIKSGTANKISVATSFANATAGTKRDLTAVAAGGTAHTLIGVTANATATTGMGDSAGATSSEVTHVGWVKKTVGTGGRAGRVFYETLVAASSISGDGEDITTPDS